MSPPAVLRPPHPPPFLLRPGLDRRVGGSADQLSQPLDFLAQKRDLLLMAETPALPLEQRGRGIA